MASFRFFRSSPFAGWLFALLVLAPWARAQTDGSQRWAYTTLFTSVSGNIISSPAAASDGTIYIGVEVGSATSLLPGGRLMAIRPNGSLRWSFTTSDWVDSTPAVAPDGTIYFGCWNGNLYALNPDGTQKWVSAAGSFVSGSPALGADGTIYIGSGGSDLHAFNPDGSLKWTFPATDWIDSSPAIGADGTIYFGSWDNNVYAVRPEGTEKWHYATGGEVVGSPAIGADGTVYIGSRDSKLYAFTPYGMVRWSATLDDTIESTPAIAADGTLYITTTGGRLHAFNPDGTERWRYPRAGQTALNAIYSSPAVRADGTILFGTSNNSLRALRSDGTLLWQAPLQDWTDSSPLIAADGTIYIGCTDKRLYAFNGNGQPLDPASPSPGFRRNLARHGRAASIAVVIPAPLQVVPAGSSVTLSAAATATEGAVTAMQWQKNGTTIAGATTTALVLANVRPINTGTYTAVAANALATAASAPGIVGLAVSAKSLGDAAEIGTDIVHQNGNVYDQFLVHGAAATITADSGQVTRMSFIDLSDDIVQVEFSGAGTLSLVLDNVGAPAPAANYNQPGILYVKGHPGIVIAGADETTNVSVFSVGRITAINQTLFKDDVTYDGFADLSFLAILSPTGRFGGARLANTGFLAAKGITGVYAPGIQFTGPVFVGNITASETATPMLVLGSAADTRITGGDLLQANNRPVIVSGITQLSFTDGSDSHGTLLPAQANQAQLEENNSNVTAQVVVDP